VSYFSKEFKGPEPRDNGPGALRPIIGKCHEENISNLPIEAWEFRLKLGGSD
jgi:hypothetical protein